MKFNKTTLDNGMRIITIPQPNALAMTALILVATGSKYENKSNSGIAHFLEHMCFKGTKNRPKNMQIAHELSALGAQNNAFTSHEYTGYYAKVGSDKASQILEITADLYLNPIFKEEEIEKEKGVIIEELNMYEDSPQRKIAEEFLSLLYGDQPAGWDIGGDKEVIRGAKQKDFINFRSDHYLPQSTVLVLAGNFDEKALLKQAEDLFKGMELGEKKDKLPTKEAQSKPALHLKEKKLDQAHLVLGYRTTNLFDKRRPGLNLLADILGGGMSSRLFERLREKMGAAYYVWADADFYTDHGYLAAGAGVELSKAQDAVRAIKEEFEHFINEPVSAEELQRHKSHLTGNLQLSLETSDRLAVFYGIQEVLAQEIKNTEDILKLIQAVSVEEIQSLAQEFFKPENLNLAILGPFKEKEPFEKILEA